VWLAIELSIVGFALVLIALAALSTWRRWQKMRRAGGRFGRRLGSLGEAAGSLTEQFDGPERLS
jgi:hypothetical protein